MKVHAFIDVESNDQIQKILEETDLKPLMELGRRIWEVKGGEFEINVPGGKIIYKPEDLVKDLEEEFPNIHF